MGRIQATVGLVTGLPIEETVNKLIAIQARPRDLLAQRTRRLEDQRLAITQLTANLIALQVTTTRLAAASLYTARAASSSDAAVLAATLSGEPPEGTYAFTPLAKAQAQQWQSAPLASRTAALGGGTLSLRFGGFVDTPIQLDLLNGGQGVARGKLRITDRSGASAVIDLTAARNIDDVLRAINSQTAINVRAETVAGRIRLLDLTGQSSANLSVQEVDGGTTAASLRAGVPSIVVPHILDQFIWGQRIHELGAGPQPIPRSRLTVAKLAEALVRMSLPVSLVHEVADMANGHGRYRNRDMDERAVEFLR